MWFSTKRPLVRNRVGVRIGVGVRVGVRGGVRVGVILIGFGLD